MWSPVLSQSISLVPMAPGCYSSSPLEYLSWTHPLSSIAPGSDLSLASWEPFFLMSVHVPMLPLPPYLQASLDS
jgi:hypothetical protein